MRRGRNTARGKSILVAGPIHVHKKRELAQNLLDLHFLEACLNKQQQHFEKCCSLYFARILIFKINNVVKLVQKSLASLQENIFLRISNFIPTQPRLRASIYHSFYNIQLDIFAVLTLNFFRNFAQALYQQFLIICIPTLAQIVGALNISLSPQIFNMFTYWLLIIKHEKFLFTKPAIKSSKLQLT